MDADRLRAIQAQVAAIIRASGGWNARARARLAFYAATKRVDPRRITQAVQLVAGLGKAGGATTPAARPASNASPGAPAVAAAPAAAAAPAKPAALAAPTASTAPTAPAAPAVHSGSLSAVLSAAALTLGVAIAAVLVWLAMDLAARPPAPPPSLADQARLEPQPEDPPSSGDARPESRGETRTEVRSNATPGTGPAPGTTPGSRTLAPERVRAGGRTVPVPPAVFPRSPVLQGDLSSQESRSALETLSSGEGALLRAVARASSVDTNEAEEQRRMVEALLDAWPLIERHRAQALLDAFARAVPRWPIEVRTQLEDSCNTALNAPPESLDAWWRAAGAAGLRSLLQGASSDGPSASFGMGALDWLGARTDQLAALPARGDPARTADLYDGWVAAASAALQLEATDGLAAWYDSAVLRAVEALLRTGAALDRPGTPAEALGTLLDAVPWAGSRSQRDRVAEAWKAWMADPKMPSAALHGLTSVLAARRPGAWWDPWMVVDARATPAERAEASDVMVRALRGVGPADEPARAVRLPGVDPALIARWKRVRDALAAKPEPVGDAHRIARAAEWMALVETARHIERGRLSDADARLAQLENTDGLAPDEADRWKDGPPSLEVRVPARDGLLEAELRNPRALADRLDALRALRTRPIHDLGPKDAEVLAREALASSSPQMRSVAQGVIVDVLGQGPRIVAALLAEVNAAVSVSELAQLAGSLSGQPVPRGSDAAVRAASALLLADRLSSLVPSDRHAINASARELALAAASAARALGAEVPAGATPESAMRAWADARTAEARRVAPRDTLDQARARADAHSDREGLPQRFVRAQTLLLEVDAAIAAAHFPRQRTEIAAVVEGARGARSAAGDVMDQMDINARALAELAARSLGVEGANK
jgi:hypothetical protein